MARIGVLGLQGGFSAHIDRLRQLDHDPLDVRSADLLEQLDGLILPGGESTTQLKLIERFGLFGSLDHFARNGKPILATCAGIILAARHVTHPSQTSFGWLDIAVNRNAYGRQLDSFETRSDDGLLPLVFIRAPRIVEWSDDVEVLATLKGEPILVRQGNVFGTTFHPELTDDLSVHRMVFGNGRSMG